ncbi:MAG TPA: hypothetical protein VFS12_17425 [Terriglobia bacterium]|nr:hypothetical protein [Terriglobia bacterium]
MINAFAKIQSLMGGIILGVFLLGILSKGASSSGVIVASILGLAAVLYVFVFTSISLFWYCVIGCLTTLLVGWLWGLIRPSESPGTAVAAGLRSAGSPAISIQPQVPADREADGDVES